MYGLKLYGLECNRNSGQENPNSKTWLKATSTLHGYEYDKQDSIWLNNSYCSKLNKNINCELESSSKMKTQVFTAVLGLEFFTALLQRFRFSWKRNNVSPSYVDYSFPWHSQNQDVKIHQAVSICSRVITLKSLLSSICYLMFLGVRYNIGVRSLIQNLICRIWFRIKIWLKCRTFTGSLI